MNKTKKILLVVGFIVLLGGIVVFSFFNKCGLFKNCMSDKNISEDSIVLKIPQISYQEPGNILSEVIITGYTNKTIKKEEEFIIESASLGSLWGSKVGDVRLKINDIKSDSVVVDVLADKRSDQGFRPRDQIVQTEILNGSCIWAYPLVTDSSYEYCFEPTKENGKLALKYRLQGESTMPTP